MVLAGAFAGGFVTSLAGFGTGLVVLGIWLHFTHPAPAPTSLGAADALVGLAGQCPGWPRRPVGSASHNFGWRCTAGARASAAPAKAMAAEVLAAWTAQA